MRSEALVDRLCLVSLTALWGISLALPAVEIGQGFALTGWELLRSGWRAVFDGMPAWYANPLFFLTMVAALKGRDRIALGLAAAAAGVASTTFAAEIVLGGRGVGLDGLTWRSGFFVWLAAIAGLLPWAALRRIRRIRRSAFRAAREGPLPNGSRGIDHLTARAYSRITPLKVVLGGNRPDSANRLDA